MKKLAILLFGGMYALLSACGGGGVSVAPTITPPPITTPQPPPSTPKSQWDTAEYNGGFNWYSVAVNALYAYDRGFHGQGVTVAFWERGIPNYHHDDFRRQPFLADETTMFQDPGVYVNGGTGPYRPGDIETKIITDHASGVAGVIGGARNDNLSHGVAPSVILVHDHNENILDSQLSIANVQIYNRSNYLFPVLDTGGNLTLFENKEDLIRRRDANLAAFREEGWMKERAAIMSNNAVAVWSAGNEGDRAPFGYAGGRDMPLIEEDLEPHWVAVVGLDFVGHDYTHAELTLVDYSNACGHAKMWCVAAPAEHIWTPFIPRNGNNNVTLFTNRFGATSAAAPVVSGVLAVMKSAADTIAPMPMTVIRAIMLSTATDLGDPGIDEIYGWGLPNLEEAIMTITSMKTANLAGMSAVPLRSLRHEFPAEFSRLRGQLSELTVAIEITDGAYYNMPLADIIPPQTQTAPKMGAAAADMLDENAPENGKSFWFAASSTPKTGGMVGAGVGAEMGVRHALGGGFFAFGEYGAGVAKLAAGHSQYISAASRPRTEEWRFGLDAADVWQKGDKWRFSVRQERRVSGGRVAVNLPTATGDFYQSFLGEKAQNLSVRRTEISIAEKMPLIFSAGYSAQFGGGQWAAAAELAETGDGKLSAKWRVEF